MVSNMLRGILFCFCTGLCWACIGIVLSCCASKKLAVIPYSFLQTLLTGTAALFLVDFRKIGLHDLYILAGFIFLGGLLNPIGQNTVHNAMKRGHHTPVWAISQSALIFPFLTGILFFHEQGSAGHWIGTVLIVSGILVTAMEGVKNVSGWIIPAVTAFFIFGMIQVLHSMPSQLYGFRDPAGARPLAVAWGGTTGWLLIAACGKASLRFDGKTLLIAGGMVLVQLLALRLFFLSLDTLAAGNCVNIAFPLMTGTNISAFAVYSIFIRREKTSLTDRIGFLLALAGLFFIAL